MANNDVAVLVVDDDEVSRHLLVRCLSQEGYAVTSTGSGREALALISRRPFDLVVLDIEMPDINGLEVLLAIRQDHSLAELPVIVVSGRGQAGDVTGTLRLGANDYVTKPVLVPLLASRVHNLLAMTPRGGARRPALALDVGSRPEAPALSMVPSGRSAGQAGQTEDRRPAETPNPRRLDPQAAPTRVTDVAPFVIGEYAILGELGRGGMGVVYKARHLRLNRLAALKVLSPDHLYPGAVRRFYREAEAAAQLHHPNIVLAYDAGEVGHLHYLALEYVEGTDLGVRVKESGPLPVGLACDCIRQAARGLYHAHTRGMVHRDVKPSNLILSAAPAVGQAHGVVKVLDLGLALLGRVTEPKRSASLLTGEGHWLGTADYIAPEQASDAHAVDHRADLYSLGCTMYELLTGRVPFPDCSPIEKALKHLSEAPAAVEAFRPEVPAAVTAVVRRLMMKRPEGRYPSAAEVADALEAWCGPAGSGATSFRD